MIANRGGAGPAADCMLPMGFSRSDLAKQGDVSARGFLTTSSSIPDLAHVVLLKTTNSFPNSDFGLSTGSHGNKAKPMGGGQKLLHSLFGALE